MIPGGQDGTVNPNTRMQITINVVRVLFSFLSMNAGQPDRRHGGRDGTVNPNTRLYVTTNVLCVCSFFYFVDECRSARSPASVFE